MNHVRPDSEVVVPILYFINYFVSVRLEDFLNVALAMLVFLLGFDDLAAELLSGFLFDVVLTF